VQKNEILLRYGAKDLPSCIWQFLDEDLQEVAHSATSAVRDVWLVLHEVGGHILLKGGSRPLID
jgi:hypothetical protein